jgi:hypothetical protein
MTLPLQLSSQISVFTDIKLQFHYENYNKNFNFAKMDYEIYFNLICHPLKHWWAVTWKTILFN